MLISNERQKGGHRRHLCTTGDGPRRIRETEMTLSKFWAVPAPEELGTWSGCALIMHCRRELVAESGLMIWRTRSQAAGVRSVPING